MKRTTIKIPIRGRSIFDDIELIEWPAEVTDDGAFAIHHNIDWGRKPGKHWAITQLRAGGQCGLYKTRKAAIDALAVLASDPDLYGHVARKKSLTAQPTPRGLLAGRILRAQTGSLW